MTFSVGIPELMVCFNHSTQKQTLDYLCVQPEEIKSVYMKVQEYPGPEIIDPEGGYGRSEGWSALNASPRRWTT